MVIRLNLSPICSRSKLVNRRVAAFAVISFLIAHGFDLKNGLARLTLLL